MDDGGSEPIFFRSIHQSPLAIELGWGVLVLRATRL
jgi:hypothetical protein